MEHSKCVANVLMDEMQSGRTKYVDKERKRKQAENVRSFLEAFIRYEVPAPIRPPAVRSLK